MLCAKKQKEKVSGNNKLKDSRKLQEAVSKLILAHNQVKGRQSEYAERAKVLERKYWHTQ